jgi:hypothetical protein
MPMISADTVGGSALLDAAAGVETGSHFAAVVMPSRISVTRISGAAGCECGSHIADVFPVMRRRFFLSYSSATSQWLLR